MLRSTRPLWASSTRAVASRKASIVSSPQSCRQVSQFSSLSSPRVVRAPRVSQTTFLIHKTQYATKPPPKFPASINAEEEKKFGERKLESNPAAVTVESSVRHFVEPSPDQDQPEVTAGIKHDLNLVKETFALNTVPKESYILGLAGTVPYLATSLSTVYLSWALNTEWPTVSAFKNNILMSHESAQYWLGVVEPVQLGYGAVIISFLGAIHWGLEYAEKKPSYPRTQFRYGLGLLAPVVAWPTLFMPWQFALTTQFAAFVGLYFADSRASIRGWAPYWYNTYRFVLTAIVGVAIMISLIGRAKIGDAAPRLSGLREKFHQKQQGEESYSAKWEEAEEEERKRQKKVKEEEEKKKKKEEAEQKKKEAAEKKKKKENKGKEDKGGKGKEDAEDEGDDSEGEKSDGGDDDGNESGDEESDEGSEDDQKAKDQGEKDAKKDDKESEKKDDKK